ncbi:hypothetical protein CCAX7_30090 [Capsulimonas corticalis]|uniref:Uncharacterized protein n=1 Tax=Capsulimonas corticalis TaxID=2219043 RepID=A0A402CSU2_9BACT|nr:hypothetical protein [Capsulimonas corticalis]BDI30958.1 hypothetical protein CCAX7_30090 [Capsulimonas corticalis]
MPKTNSQLITDDSEVWSRVLALYGNKPCWRSRLHSHLPLSMRENPRLLMPLLRKSLACPGAFADALYVSSLCPELTQDIMESLKQPDLRAAVSRDQIVSSLACLFGVTFHPGAFLTKSAGEQARIFARVRSEFARRFSLDFETTFGGERLSFESVNTQNDGPGSQPLRKSY